MFHKSTKITDSNNDSLKSFKTSDDCKVSKASNEIMLDRFYNGKGIEFPFSNAIHNN